MNQALAIKEQFAGLFTAPPSMNVTARAKDDIKGFERLVEKLDGDMAVWRAKTVATFKAGFDKIASSANDLPPEIIAAVVSEGTSAVIMALDHAIQEASHRFDERTEFKDALAAAEGISPSTARYLRKIYRRIERMRVAHYNTCVDLYYAVLAFRSEYEDQSEVVTFTSASELERFLRSDLVA